MFDQLFSSAPWLPNSLNGNGGLVKSLDGTIERRAGESAGTSHEGNPASPEVFRIESSNQVLLSLVQMRKQ